MTTDPKQAVCYCGGVLKPYGDWWLHLDNSEWCYKEEAGLDDDSRCSAMPDPDAEDDE